jgi:hypothetical protein
VHWRGILPARHPAADSGATKQEENMDVLFLVGLLVSSGEWR